MTIFRTDEEVIRFEEWNNQEKCVKNGLTVVVERSLDVDGFLHGKFTEKIFNE